MIHIQRVLRVALALLILFMAAMPSNGLAQASPQAQNDNLLIQKYRQLIPRLMAEQDIPGLAVAVVDDTGMLWAEGFGFTDNDRKIPVTPDTIFSVQSISKNFTAAAVLSAVQEGVLDLDAPITTYLPDFTIHSIFEDHPERKITLRMLLSHTAGLTMEAPVGNNYDLGSVAFEDHIRTISDTWLRFPVGTGHAYSNLGISLAGYILQKVSGLPFATYVEDHLLHRVGMDNSSFDMVQIRVNPNRAIGHSKPMPKVPLEIPLIPEGGLYTSANDMAKYIQFHLNQGSVNGQSVLSPALLDEMYTGRLGVGREHWHRNRETDLLFHGGGGFGFLADLYWCPELKIGITVLTNSADHQLQGDLALQILNDFIHDPNSVYYSRLMALPNRAYVSDSQKGLPLDLAQAIEQHAPQTTDQDRLRWGKYIGAYSTTNWGVINPLTPSAEVHQVGSHLYIIPDNIPGDAAKDLQLTEVSPGLFYAENGEALDFRGAVPTWRNIKLTKIDTGPSSWQQAILAVCVLTFLSALLVLPLRVIVRHFRRSVQPGTARSRWARLVSPLAVLTSLFGLVSIGLVVAIPMIIYSGFLGWLELPLGLRLLMHMPFAFLVAGVGFLALIVPAWKNHWWSRRERAYFLVFSFASVTAITLFSYWNLIGLGLG